jgi:hypothetical protein
MLAAIRGYDQAMVDQGKYVGLLGTGTLVLLPYHAGCVYLHTYHDQCKVLFGTLTKVFICRIYKGVSMHKFGVHIINARFCLAP